MRLTIRAAMSAVLLTLTLVPAGLAASSSLSSSEYQQLTALNTRLNHLKSGVSTNAIASDVRACSQTPRVSPLVTGVASDCGSVFNLLGSMLSLKTIGTKCLKNKKGAYTCILTAYKELYNRTTAVYGSDLHVRSLVLARGLGAACASNLADTPAVISLENKLTGVAAQMLIDVKTHQGKALVSDSAVYTKDFGKILSGSNSASILTGCAHQ